MQAAGEWYNSVKPAQSIEGNDDARTEDLQPIVNYAFENCTNV